MPTPLLTLTLHYTRAAMAGLACSDARRRVLSQTTMHFTGIIIAMCAVLVIGVFHPIVIKTEYYTGTRYWWVFLVLGLGCLTAALFVADTLASALLGIVGASLLWSIRELFEQRERVRKGWFPKRDTKR